ncbi:hypothetical protein C0995_007663 [Termitomyces sp. Mi166|nr:hypothetical protein C0995_007663 [Termitomyces sp. Mi166\
MPVLPWPWRSEPLDAPNNDPRDVPKTSNDSDANIQRLGSRLPSILLVLSSLGVGIALTMTSIAFINRWVRGVVTSVGDADNFRLYHTPPFGFRWPFKFRRIPSVTKELKDETLHIRIAGMDAPEGAHFGRPAQPYFTESLAWLRGKISGKSVYCQLLRRDQYSRIVANVLLSPRILPRSLFSGKVLALEMLRAGWATTYEQTGAEYGKVGKDEFLRVEAEAKAARRGMWAKGINAETPAEFKRRHAAASSPEEAEAMRVKSVSSSKTQAKKKKKSWLRRMLGW